MKTSSVGLILLIGLAAPAAFGKAALASKPAAVPKDKRDPASSGGYFRAVGRAIAKQHGFKEVAFVQGKLCNIDDYHLMYTKLDENGVGKVISFPQFGDESDGGNGVMIEQIIDLSTCAKSTLKIKMPQDRW